MATQQKTKPNDIESMVIDRCLSLGFALAGITPADSSRWPDSLVQWLEDGKHGEMNYLKDRADQMIDPQKMVPGAQSIICVADRYHRSDLEPSPPPSHGRIARYARGKDYHRVMKKRLHQLCDELRSQFPDEIFRPCVDTAPVLEREHAQRAGLGAVGKHTLVIERGVGSWILLGEIITTLILTPSTPTEEDPCGTCTRCLDACPTDAITPFSVDATRCISYLTIEHRGVIDQRFHKAIGDWIFGCDICQEVCPHNQPSVRSAVREIHPDYVPRHSGFDLLTVLGWTEEDRRVAFTTSSLKRAKLDMMKRNALIAAGNVISEVDRESERTRLLEKQIEIMARDNGVSDLVRETAQQVMIRLGKV